jgi:hypothetical protein
MNAFPKTRAAAVYAGQHGHSDVARARAAAVLERIRACEAVVSDPGDPPPVIAAHLLRRLVLAVHDLAGPAWLKASGDDDDVAAFTALQATPSPPDPATVDEICSRVLWARFSPAVSARDSSTGPRAAAGRPADLNGAAENAGPDLAWPLRERA